MNIIVEVPHVFLKSSNRLLKIGLSMSVEKKNSDFPGESSDRLAQWSHLDYQNSEESSLFLSCAAAAACLYREGPQARGTFGIWWRLRIIYSRLSRRVKTRKELV